MTARRFKRELLPPPRPFYEKELGRLMRSSRAGWIKARCPFHRPDKNPSFSVNMNSGGFYCFSCGAKGGDVLDFIMQRDDVSFKAAALRLGVWVEVDENSTGYKEIVRELRKCEEVREAARQLAEEEKRLRLGYRQTIHAMERIVQEMKHRLLFHQSDPEREVCGNVLTMALDELREAIAAYYLLSFGSIAERSEYVRNCDRRDQIVMAVILRGTVSDDSGHILDIALS